jgi:hypothetical protein
MAIHTVWDDSEGYIIRLDFDRDWHWSDYRNALEKAAALQAEVGTAVGLLHNVPGQVRLPDMFLSNIGPFIECDYPVALHTAVVVTPDLLSEMMLRAIFRIYGDTQPHYVIFRAHTLEDARATIYRRAAELGD